MEIRTCEEYVLEELRAAQQEVERLRGALHRNIAELNHAVVSNADITDDISKVAKVLDIKIKYEENFDYNYIEVDGIYVFSERHNPEGYKLIKNFFNLSEPEPENDRTEESAATD